MDNKLPLLVFALRSIDKSSLEKLTATDIAEVEDLEETLEKQYGINIVEKDALSPASPTPPLYVYKDTPEPPALVNCSFKDGKARRRERRAQKRMMKKQNKRY